MTTVLSTATLSRPTSWSPRMVTSRSWTSESPELPAPKPASPERASSWDAPLHRARADPGPRRPSGRHFFTGTVCYELLTHRPPFSGEDVMELVDQIRSSEPVRPTDVNPDVPPTFPMSSSACSARIPINATRTSPSCAPIWTRYESGLPGAAQQTRGPVRPRATALGGQVRHQESGDSGDPDGREAAEDARKAMDRARRGGESGLIELAPDEWMKAASLEAQANAALDRGDYATAQSLFMGACKVYDKYGQFVAPTMLSDTSGGFVVGLPRLAPHRPTGTPLPGAPNQQQMHADETVVRPFPSGHAGDAPRTRRAIATVRSRSTPLSWRT